MFLLLGNSPDPSSELLPVLLCELTHLPATDSCGSLRSFGLQEGITSRMQAVGSDAVMSQETEGI